MPSREQVFEVVKEQILEVLFELDPDQIEIHKSLRELGANSLDRSEIALNAMEALSLSFPARELASVSNIEGLVDLLHRKAEGEPDPSR